MTRFAIIQSNTVVNIVAGDQTFADFVATNHPDWTLVPLPDPVEIGFTWDGSKFSPPPVVDPQVAAIGQSAVQVIALLKSIDTKDLSPEDLAKLNEISTELSQATSVPIANVTAQTSFKV